MRYLLDTGVLARLHQSDDPLYQIVRQALFSLRDDGHVFVTSTQNMTELWNVLTRPVEARGGFGLTIEAAESRLKLLEELARVLREPDSCYTNWKKLVVQHRVSGRSVHDARLVALMKCHRIKHILTLNDADFKRYQGIHAVNPSSYGSFDG